jgi:hypothetical protein
VLVVLVEEHGQTSASGIGKSSLCRLNIQFACEYVCIVCFDNLYFITLAD